MGFKMGATSAFVPTCQQLSNTEEAPKAFQSAPLNSFNAQLRKNGFTVNAKAFTPSEFVPTADKFPLTMNSIFPSTTNIRCTSEESTVSTEGS